MPDTPRLRRVLMSEELFRELGATKVDWGEQDKYGFYTPTVYRDERAHIDALTAAVEALPVHKLDAIRLRVDIGANDQSWQAYRDRRALLAHIDALTAAVEGLEPMPNEDDDDSDWISKTDVLAILRGEQ